jgi:hypothetical protein
MLRHPVVTLRIQSGELCVSLLRLNLLQLQLVQEALQGATLLQEAVPADGKPMPEATEEEEDSEGKGQRSNRKEPPRVSEKLGASQESKDWTGERPEFRVRRCSYIPIATHSPVVSYP